MASPPVWRCLFMPQIDGAIRIVTKITTRDAEESLASLEWQIKKSAKYIDSLRSKMDALKGQKIPTEDYEKVQEELAAAEKNLSDFIAKQNKLKEIGVASGAEWDALNKKIAEAGDQVQSVKAKMQALTDAGKDFTLGENTEQYHGYEQQIQNEEEAIVKAGEHYQKLLEAGSAADRTSEAYKKYQATLDKLRNSETGMVSVTDATKAALIYLADVVKEKLMGLAGTIKDSVMHPFRTLKSVASGAFHVIVTGAKGAVIAVRSVASAFSKICSGIKNIGIFARKAFSALTGGLKQSNTSLTGNLKTILKYGFGIRSLYVLFNKIRSGIKEGFTNLMNYSGDFADSIQSVKNSMNTLGNQIAAAFSPVVQMVIPWLNQLISALSRAMTYVAQFIASLTGKSTFTKAVQIQDKYNKSLGGTAKAADKARGALAKFDDLDVLQKEDNAGSSGGSAGATDPADMFEESEVSDKWKNIADWFREMWENSDFYALGKLLGEKLKEALENIDWIPIQETAQKIGTSFATLINGFVEVDGLADSIGRNIGEAINTGLAGINAFLDNTHWDSIGQFIGEGLNGVIDAVEWDSLGHFFAEKWNALFEVIGEAARTFDWTNFGASLAESVNTWIADFNWAENGAHLGELIKGLLDTLIAFLEETDWQALGNGVAEFIGSVDWTGLFERLAEGIGAALGGLAAFLWGLIEKAWKSVVDWWHDVAYEDGEFTMQGLFDGIIEALGNVANWIKEHIIDPFLKGIRDGFGIHSPSTVMAEIGGYLIEGLKNGITNAWSSLKETIGGVASGVLEKFRDVFDIHSPSAVMDENGVYLIEGLKNGVSENVGSVLMLFDSLKASIMEILRELNESTALAFSEMITMMMEQWRQMLRQTQTAWTTLVTLIKQGLTAINMNILSSMALTNANWASSWSQMVQRVIIACREIINAVQAMNDQVRSMCNDMIAAINAVKSARASIGGGGFNGGDSRAAVPSMVSYMPDIPRLATGAVIRGGNPFMAILGDQPAGKTNIETPANLIKDMVTQGIAEAGIGSRENIPVNINIVYDGETTARVMIPDILSELGRQGYNVEVLGVT